MCFKHFWTKSHCHVWHTESKSGGHIQSDAETKPGDAVGTDQLVFAQPGWIPQSSGTLTSTRINCATVFANHVMKYIYVHLMCDLTIMSTLEVKAACKKVFADFGKGICH